MTDSVAVLVRRVPDPTRLAIDRRSGRLVVEDLPFILNPVDQQALELALRLREHHQFRIVVLSVDHTGAESELREALALGADEAILLSDPAFEGTDPGSQAHVFHAALEKFVHPRVVLAASRSIDHTWSTIGPQLAFLLDWPLVIEGEEISVGAGMISGVAHTGGFRARFEADLPAVVTVARGVVDPRKATAWGVADSYDEHRLVVRSLEDLVLSPDRMRALAPKTQVKRIRLTPRTRARRIIEGEPDDVARVLARRLIDKGWGGRRP